MLNHLFTSFIFLILAIQQPSANPAAIPEWINITPEQAKSHLITSAKLVYPPCVTSAGVEGKVVIQIGIYTDGLVHSVTPMSGPICLRGAAISYLTQRKYQPFMKNGQLVNASVDQSVIFKVPHGIKTDQTQKVLHRRDLEGLKDENTEWDELSTAMKEWLSWYSQQNASIVGGQIPIRRALTKKKRATPLLEDMPGDLTIQQIPLHLTGRKLYLLRDEIREHENDHCGVTGNCPIALLEESERGIELVIFEIGFDVHLHHRKDSPYPDVFITGNAGAMEQGMIGYRYMDNQWVPLYCWHTHDYENIDSKKMIIEVCH